MVIRKVDFAFARDRDDVAVAVEWEEEVVEDKLSGFLFVIDVGGEVVTLEEACCCCWRRR